MMFFFGNPLFLYGLAAVSMPVIIHLVHIRKVKLRPFSTLRFLRFSLKKQARKLKLNNLLLLFLRIGIIAFLSLALAEPVLKVSKFPIIGRNASSSVVIILDNSYSMGYREEGISLLDRARKTGIDILDTLERSDEVAIILMNEDADLVFKEFTHDLPLAKSLLAGVSLSYEGTDVGKSLEKAYEFLGRSNKMNREIYLLSDLQKNGWHSILSPEGGGDRWRKAAVYIIPFGNTNADNVFIEGVDFPSHGHVAGLPIELSVKIVNLSSEPVNEMVTLTLNGVKKLKLPVLLSSGPEIVKMVYTFPGPGTYSGKVSIKGDKLVQDDSCYFRIRIEDKLPVLCVDGDPSGVSALSESFYLMTALNPAFGISAVMPVMVELPELKSKNLFEYRVVILCNVPRLEGADLINIEQYLKAGGNLIIFLGSRIKPAEYNRWEFIPSPVLNLEGYRDKENYFNLDLIDYTHPIFRKFSLPENGDLTLPKFYQCYSVREDSECRVLASFTNGFPAFLESSYGAGKVILITTTADSDWANLPVRVVYPPLVHQMVHYMSGMEASKKYLVGDSVSFQTTLSGHKRITVTNPESLEFTLVPLPEDGRGIATFYETQLPGVYTVLGVGFPAERKEFVVNLDTTESILARIALEKISEVFGEGLVIVDNPERVSMLIKRSRRGVELWSRILLLALVFFIAELFLANRLSYQRNKIVSLMLTITMLMALSPFVFAGGNLIRNPGFENGRKGNKNLPECWDMDAIEKKHVSQQYAAQNVRLAKAGRGKSLRFNLTKRVAAGPGVGFTSGWVEIDSGKEYESKVDVKSYGPKAVIFCIGYAIEEGERKVIYRSKILLDHPSGNWQTLSKRFPSKSGRKRFNSVKWMRVKLYAYHPAGEIFFDNVSLRVAGE